MAKKMTLGQMDQLREIDRAGNGIGDEIQELIRRLTSGGVAGKSDYTCVVQAKRFWDLGVGRVLGLKDFDAYLATIPEIPGELTKADMEFPTLVLVEPRIGLKRLCGLAGITFTGDDHTFVTHDERRGEFTQPTWVRIQDGRKNRNRVVRDCWKSFSKQERGLTALQGVCAFIQDQYLVEEGGHIMDLIGSVRGGNRALAACLGVWGGQPELFWINVGLANPRCGSASRRE